MYCTCTGIHGTCTCKRRMNHLKAHVLCVSTCINYLCIHFVTSTQKLYYMSERYGVWSQMYMYIYALFNL